MRNGGGVAQFRRVPAGGCASLAPLPCRPREHAVAQARRAERRQPSAPHRGGTIKATAPRSSLGLAAHVPVRTTHGGGPCMGPAQLHTAQGGAHGMVRRADSGPPSPSPSVGMLANTSADACGAHTHARTKRPVERGPRQGRPSLAEACVDHEMHQSATGVTPWRARRQATPASTAARCRHGSCR